MNLLQWGNFTLHAGQQSQLKIDCDALTDDDWATAASIVARVIQFQDVIGIATGGTAFAKALEPYRSHNSNHPMLIVDDVYTTGVSMKNMYALLESSYGKNIMGAVLYARGPCPEWVNPIFFLHPALIAL